MIQRENLHHIDVATHAIETMYKEMRYGELKVHVFRYLLQNRHKILEISQISSKLNKDEFQRAFNDRQEELEIYGKFVDDTSKFWTIFRFIVEIKGNFI